MDERPGGEFLDDTAFDEAQALAELDEVRQEIARYKAVREGVSDEFERFVQSFKKPEPSQQPPAPPSRPSPVLKAPPPAPVVLPPVVPPPIVPPPIGPPPLLQPASARFEPLNLEAFIREEEAPDAEDDDESFAPGVDFDSLPPPLDPVEESLPVTAPPPASRLAATRTWMVLGAVIAVIVVGGYAWKLGQSSDATSVEQPAATPAGETQPVEQPAATPARGTQPVEQPAATPARGTQPNTQRQGGAKGASPAPTAAGQRTTDSGPRTEIVTTQRAWVRVIADGERVIERVLPAGSRIPLTATKTIQVRTGNAGAVRVTIGGVNHGALGRAGEVVSRTFKVPRQP